MSPKLRLDELLVARGFYPTRSRASDAIRRGTIRIDGEPADKPARKYSTDALIEPADAARRYVSRAALKLLHGLAYFAIDPRNRNALDIGASTGGFTQVLLEQGAAHVTALDVGHGQLADVIRHDPRVTAIEGLNARDLTTLPHAIHLIVCDVSFISLKLALPPALSLAANGADLVALIKPQFEAGRDAIGKGGIVTDPQIHARVYDDISIFLESQGWTVTGTTPSPIEGGDGNKEFLIGARK